MALVDCKYFEYSLFKSLFFLSNRYSPWSLYGGYGYGLGGLYGGWWGR
jgi:hypothetical protein